MKLTITNAFVIIQSVVVLGTPSANPDCGDLGVMNVKVSEIPPGTDLDAIRQCKEHPAGAASEPSIHKRDCWFGKTFGCSESGWCYKRCSEGGDGAWCWTALNNGYGDWISCGSDAGCSDANACGKGSCDACGCSC